MEKPLALFSPDEIRKSRIWARKKLLQIQVILRREPRPSSTVAVTTFTSTPITDPTAHPTPLADNLFSPAPVAGHSNSNNTTTAVANKRASDPSLLPLLFQRRSPFFLSPSSLLLSTSSSSSRLFVLEQERLMSAADNLGNLFVALLAGIPLLIFVLFACCACLEASISAARRSYKPHLPTRVRFADEEAAGDESNDGDDGGGSTNGGNDNRRQSRNPLLFGVSSTARSTNRSGRLEGSGLIAHSTYIQRFPNYRYSPVVQSSGRTSPPPGIAKSRTELGSGSIKSPLISPLIETQKLLDKESHPRSTPTRTPTIGSPAYPLQTPTTAAPGKAVRQEIPNSSATTDTQQNQQISQKSSPTHLSNVLNYFDESSRRSSTSTPTTSPTFQMRPKSPFEGCGPHVDPHQQQRYSTPSSPTMYAYQQRPQGPSTYSSMSYLPEVKTYLHFMEDDFSNRQRSHSFSGRSARRSLNGQRVVRTPSPFTLDRTMIDDETSKMSTPSSFGTTFLTPPGSTDQGSFKSPESGTPDWLLSSDVPPSRLITLIDDSDDVLYKQLSRSKSSIRTAFL